MKLLKHLVLILFVLVFACKNNSKPDLASLNLLRGELVLCSGDQFGEVSFALNCDYDVRETFNLALALLHSFEYEEAEKAFVQVLDDDSECTMAYWGVAMSISHSLWNQSDKSYLKKGEKILKTAHTLKANNREQDYLKALTAYYKDHDSLSRKERARIYENEIEKVYKKYPEDTEAAVFYSLALRAAADYDDYSYTKQKKSGEILEKLFKEQPNHPGIAHYIIHNYDYTVLAHKALPIARRYAKIAPASSHAQHMPSHIFTRLGLWEESIESNVNSASSARCYAEATAMDGHWSSELHAMDYLVYAYLQRGDNKNANELLNYTENMKRLHSTGTSSAAYAIAAIPSRVYLENKQWDLASTLEPFDVNFTWKDYPWQKASIYFTRAMGFAHLKNFNQTANELTTLNTLREELIEMGKEGSARQILIQIKTVEAIVEYNKGNYKEGISLIQDAIALENKTKVHGVTPARLVQAREYWGNMLLDQKKPEEALNVFEESMKVSPNRFNGLYGAAIAAKQSGNKDKATIYFESLLKLTENTNSDRPELIEAKKYLNKKTI